MPYSWREDAGSRTARPIREPVQVVRFSNLEPLAPLAGPWDRLAGEVPFRSWAWLSAWWRHYGNGCTQPLPAVALCVLGVIDSCGDLVGIAPWYIERTATRGRVLRALGSGEVCSDYVSLLCRPEHAASVAASLAEWLMAAQSHDSAEPADWRGHRWDLLELTAVDSHDAAICSLCDALETHDCAVYRRPGPNCWRIDLPDSWEQYLAMLSKDHRKQVRRAWDRLFRPGRAVLRTASSEKELADGVTILSELHRRRRNLLGQPGCFASSRFAAFHGEVMHAMLETGRLGLHWIELNGVAVAAEYQLLGGDTVYAYQSGIAPEALEDSPGALAHAATIRKAIEEGRRGFDFLRGDEPYKAHWRARPHANLDIHVVPPRTSARLRHEVWRSGRSVGRWLKRGWKRLSPSGAQTARGSCQRRRARDRRMTGG